MYEARGSMRVSAISVSTTLGRDTAGAAATATATAEDEAGEEEEEEEEEA
jgi:hypothetical protein